MASADGETQARTGGEPAPWQQPMAAHPPPHLPWERRFHRWGGALLLGFAVLTAVAAGDALMTRGESYAVGALSAVALGLQIWWSLVCRKLPDGARAGQVFYVVRFAVTAALSLLNGLFSIYAVSGYFDAVRTLPRRYVRAALLGTAVIMAAAQSGGLPPDGVLGWVLFGALLTVHAAMVLLFAHLGTKQAELAAAKAATIAELERTNARLALALEENAGLHAQLLLQAREAGIADERRRLAAEIHDTLAQGLTGIIMQLEAAGESADPALGRAHARRAAQLARHSLGEARRSVQNLGPGALEHDELPAALRKTAEEWSAASGIRAEFTVTGTAEPLHHEVEATLLRIAQEGLANARRHAGASRVGVTLSYMDDEVTLDIRDNGRGFDPAAPPPRRHTGGFGLGGMRARAERIAGTVHIESEPGQGTAVSARVPLVAHG